MEDDASTVTATTDRGVKTEDGVEDRKPIEAAPRPSYKSWKKKYCKMRISFDHSRDELEKLYGQEARARATARRLAIQNDKLLDLLVDINKRPQVPPERRIDLSMPLPDDSSAPALGIDSEPPPEGSNRPAKSLRDLVRDVPHLTYDECRESRPDLVDDLQPFDGEPYPPSFLTADDLDDYLYELDRSLGLELLPTMAPIARSGTANGDVAKPAAIPGSWDQGLKNLTGGYSWLRKHAPKTFLQDGEGDDDHADGTPHPRKSRGGGRERGGGRASRGGKRASTGGGRADRERERERDKDRDWDASGDEDAEYATPATGRSKRKRDDDGGYRPKGGSSGRPTKKRQRRSEAADTPTGPAAARKASRKEREREREAAEADGARGDA